MRSFTPAPQPLSSVVELGLRRRFAGRPPYAVAEHIPKVRTLCAILKQDQNLESLEAPKSCAALGQEPQTQRSADRVEFHLSKFAGAGPSE